MIKRLFLLASLTLGICACTTDYGYKIRSGRIVYDTPPRPAGQQSMLGFACDPIDTVRIGVIGLGDRGKDVPKRMAYIELKMPKAPFAVPPTRSSGGNMHRGADII